MTNLCQECFVLWGVVGPLARENGTSSAWWRSTRRASPGPASRPSPTCAGTRTVSGPRSIPIVRKLPLVIQSTVCYFAVAPTIDKGAGGSKSVKVNRLTCWRINVKVRSGLRVNRGPIELVHHSASHRRMGAAIMDMVWLAISLAYIPVHTKSTCLRGGLRNGEGGVSTLWIWVSGEINIKEVATSLSFLSVYLFAFISVFPFCLSVRFHLCLSFLSICSFSLLPVFPFCLSVASSLSFFSVYLSLPPCLSFLSVC